jgi:hypothetical protein
MLAAEALACFDAAIGQRQTRSSRPRERRVVAAAHGGSRSVAPNVGLERDDFRQNRLGIPESSEF